ncbi:MAG: hypothetical protein IJL85_03995 [Erysipelotrichaceae bacterium]|nr:hypothetical protein [Erysipelotrichaceae bacterium]
MAKFTFIIGVITLSLCMLVYELEPLWILLDLLGVILAFIGYRKGNKDCKAGLILCGIGLLFSSSFLIVMYFASHR